MPNAGKANVEVVKRMIADIRFFADAVRGEGRKMADEAHVLKQDWNDPQYEKYVKYISSLTDTLISNTSELDYCADELERRLQELLNA